MAISKRLRYEILRRDQNTCHYCGGKAPDVTLTIDHVLPVTLGGSDEANNLVAACRDCNAGKTSSSPDAPLVAQVDEAAVRYSVAFKSVVDERAARFRTENGHLERFDKLWCSWTETPMDRAGDWENSILSFLSAGVSEDYILRAVNTAMGKRYISGRKLWRYFCGICWNEVRAIQGEVAAKLAPSKPAAAGNPRDWNFPYMDMFDCFLDDAVTSLGGDDTDRKLLDWALWNSMPAAHKVWLSCEHTEDEDGSTYAREELSGHIAPYMWDIQCRRKPGGQDGA